MNLKLIIPILFTLSIVNGWQKSGISPKLELVTVATEATDGFRRFQKSVDRFGHSLHVFGMGQPWNGGNMETEGGGQKIRLLRDGLRELAAKAEPDTLVMFTDAYDVILSGDANTIIQRFLFEFSEYRLVFGAEPFCWPDKTLANKYPQVTFGERFLNSGGFIGYLVDVLKLLEEHGKDTKDTDDDQLFYTHLYLDEKIRNEYKIGLDSLSRIFQNLNGMKTHVKMKTEDDGETKMFNTLYNTHPIVIHGNGPSKIQLNAFGNYIAGQYNLDGGCEKCEPLVNFPSDTPLLALSIFVAKPTPYVEEFLQTIVKLDYSKNRINLYVYNNQPQNENEIKAFVEKHEKEYSKVRLINLDLEMLEERRGRTDAIDWAMETGVDYFLCLDADAHITNPLAIKQLLRRMLTYDIRILSPMILQPGKLFANFWGAVQSTGFYERSDDYIDLAERKRKGFWNVPFLNIVYLIHAEKLPKIREAYWSDQQVDADMGFAKFCRNNQHFMYIDNQEEYGFLVESDFFTQLNSRTINREIYDYPNNKKLWESRYIHPKYWEVAKEGGEVEMVCPDVYDFPFVSERFVSELIGIMEHFGQWSNGKNEDERLAGGYENVPTRDIHMRQVGLHGQLLSIIDDYVAPIQEKVFYGYYVRPVKSDMIFVVRYKPEEQSFLRPHLDASTYSIDVALNKRDVDYEGGGVRYVRYNCTIDADRVGWSMLFPGRLTHLHEGLPTTKGTRYILVSFINP